MDRIRYLAAGLLFLDGIIHLARLGMPPLDAIFVAVVVIFGAAYVIIGGMLLWNNKRAYYLGAIVPLIGLCVGLCGGIAGVLKNPSIGMIFLMILDAVIVFTCFYLVKKRRST